jgi:hypothetical protein
MKREHKPLNVDVRKNYGNEPEEQKHDDHVHKKGISCNECITHLEEYTSSKTELRCCIIFFIVFSIIGICGSIGCLVNFNGINESHDNYQIFINNEEVSNFTVQP